ncbi:MAG TPA: alcohol dehydrogenase [Porticoccus sp.]|nr:alcohol dehydrogenase [Porticoccus sp.]
MQQVYVHGPDDVRKSDVQSPVAGADDVIVDVAACGICGSDLAYIAMGGLPGPNGEPMPLGHELSGVVTVVGDAVDGISVGQRVVVNPMAADNSIGNGGGEGGFTQQLLVRNASKDRCLYPIPDHLSDLHGALVEPLGVAMHAVNQSDAQAGEKVVVFGAGPIGLGIVVCLRYIGVTSILVIDYSQKRLDIAMQLGAESVFNVAEGDSWAFIRKHHGRETVHGMPAAGTDVYFDAAGAAPVIRAIFEQAKFAARLIAVAMHKDEIQLPFFYVMAKELVIKGAMAYPYEFDAVIEMLLSGKVDVTPIVSHQFDFADFDQALAMAKQVDKAAKVLVTIS